MGDGGWEMAMGDCNVKKRENVGDAYPCNGTIKSLSAGVRSGHALIGRLLSSGHSVRRGL